jgi:hypothetical protein
MKAGSPSGGFVAVAVASISAGLAALGCGGSGATPAPVDEYVHYQVPDITVAAAENAMWFQWVSAPFDHDVNIVDLVASQGVGGHHALIYATNTIEPVGTTRYFENSDQYDIQFLGGIGGEGGQPVKLPDGVYFRLRAGKALAIQTHYVNASSQPIVGHTSIAVKFAEPKETDKIASMFVNTSLNIKVAPLADTQQDVTCAVQKDLPLVMYANHMHEMGSLINTTLAQPGAAPAMFKSNPRWTSEWTYNPDYSFAKVATPDILGAGTSLTTHCEWRNTSNKMLQMPDEMCVFIGFFLGPKDINCIDGHWTE